MTVSEAGAHKHRLGAIPDAEWGIGSAGVVKNASPFARVNAQRQRYFDSEYSIEADRALLVTEAYQKYDTEPQLIKVARTFAHLLRNCVIDIDEHELVVGNGAASSKACAVFPEFSYHWVEDELVNYPFRKRPHNRYHHSSEVDRQLLGIADFWRGRTVADRALGSLSEQQLAGSTHGGLGVYAIDMCINAGIGHLIPDYLTLYRLGWLGMRKQVEQKLAELDASIPENVSRRVFYRAQLITINASIDYCRRFAVLATEMAQTAEGSRREELQQIAQNCDWVSKKAPRSFWEVLQLGALATSNILIESNGHSVAFGRFDQIMYPYYRQDIDDQRITREFAQELIESTMIKFCGYMKLRDWDTTQHNSGRGLGGLTLTVGGVDEHGQDATNELTYMVLEAIPHIQLGQPWVMLRVHERTPNRLLKLACKIIKIGTGEPKLINDDVVIPGMLARGRSLKEARGYSIGGIVEPDVAGQEYSWHDAAYFNLSRVLELALNNGRPLDRNDGPSGPGTGFLADFESFEQLQQAFAEQLAYWVNCMVSSVNVIGMAHQELKPLPYLSALVGGCTERGVDVSRGGARYNFTGVQAVGLANVADALAAIKHLVFERQMVSGKQLLEALEANWENDDYLYALVNGSKVPHYGNDDDYADRIAQYVADLWCDQVAGRPNMRGGVFQPGLFSVSSNVPFGSLQAASPDGRKAGDPLSDGISPVHTLLGSHDYKGITATINSAAKLDQEAASNGVPFSIRIKPSSLQGAGAEANLISLIKSYFRAGGMHLQISVMSQETLIDAHRNPEKYRGLLVYVAGYSTLWSELGDNLKEEIINRTEVSFDENTDLTPPD